MQATQMVPATGGATLDGMECCCRPEVASASGTGEAGVECRCRLLMWQQQQEQQKMMWNAAAGY